MPAFLHFHEGIRTTLCTLLLSIFSPSKFRMDMGFKILASNFSMVHFGNPADHSYSWCTRVLCLVSATSRVKVPAWKNYALLVNMEHDGWRFARHMKNAARIPTTKSIVDIIFIMQKHTLYRSGFLDFFSQSGSGCRPELHSG